MKTVKNILATTFAIAALAAPLAARAAADGDIFEILPVDESGSVVPVPTVPLDGGDVARFAVRLMKPTLVGNQFRLKYIGLGSETVDWLSNRPAIGIYVNGKFTLAYLEKVNARSDVFTDLIFSYTVKPGDFALPIRLALANKAMVTDAATEPVGEYYLNFLDGSLGAAAWTVDDSTGTEAMTRRANFFYGTMRYSASSPDYPPTRRVDYDLAQCNFMVKTVNFDNKDESTTYWRTIHEHATEAQPVSTIPSLAVSGVPTNSVTLYVWSDNPGAVELIAGRDVANVTTRDVHVTASTTEQRQVGEIKIVAGKQDYEFNLRGVAKDNDATIVLSATPDFTYVNGTGARLDDYLTKLVRCVEPQPASVTIKPTKPVVTATSDYKTYVTELNVALSENPIDHDFSVEVVPAFSDASCPNSWWAYIRLAATTDADPTLTTPNGNPRLEFKVGETKPSSITVPTAGGDVTTPVNDGKIYLFALRSDEYVTGTKSITFAVTTSDATAILPSASGGIDGWTTPQSTLTVNAQNPSVDSMFDGTDASAAVANVDCPLQIVISDVYADTHVLSDGSEGGYEIWIKKNTASDMTFTQIPGLYYPGKGGVLVKTGTTDTQPTVAYTETGDISSTLYVVSPITGNQSANHNFTMTVTAPAGYTVETTTGEYEFDEGDEVQVKITLDKQNTIGDIYAYLKGDTAADDAVADCTWKASAGGKGRKLSNYSTGLSSGCKFVMLDGDASKMGSTFSYSVVFLTTDTWTDDPDKRVSAFQAKNTLVLTTHNVTPSVDTVTLGLYEVSESGATVGGEANPAKFPLGIEQEFSIVVDEPGDIDRNPVDPADRQFQVRWVFTDEATGSKYSPTYPASAATTGIVEGDPDTTTCKFDFPSAGRWTVTVDLRDKDMGNKWGNGTVGQKFVFYVHVIDQPSVTVLTETPYSEQGCLDFGGEAKIEVDLDLNTCTFEMWVNLLIEPNKTGGTGTFLLQEGDDVVKQPDGSYNVRFPARSTSQTIFVKTMDGTIDSRTTGFRITPTMVEDTTHIVPNSGGKHPHEYYLGVPAPRVLVYNDQPLLDEEFDVYPVPGTNSIPASIGAADEAITWSFDDVELDFTRGITVEFKGGGGWGPKTYTDRATALADGALGFIPTFIQSGEQSVKLTVKDPDGGTATVIWKYMVEPSKSMKIVAHGPAGGDVTKYDSAAGLGQGRVWAESKSAISANSFKSVINCGLASEWSVYGYGYKVGDLDDGASLHYPDGFGGYETAYYPDRDTPLNTSGANLGAGTPFAYIAPLDGRGNPVDSFLYTWMYKAAAQAGGSGGSGGGSGGATSFTLLNETTAPEYVAVGRDSGKTVTLPSETDDAGNYADTTVEAIFSIEYLASDNMGDINLDGIPDAYVNKYGFGLVDTESGASTGTDLVNLNSKELNNTDGDFLPAGVSSIYGTLIPSLPDTWATVGRPFTAKLEIRGNGESLNDANEHNPATRLANMRPDRVYTDPRRDTKSTLDGYDGAMPVEYLAWLDFAAANGLDATNKAEWVKWSPERPTDPTVDDTDEDGLPDGYEYFLWYRAHVGYNDGGEHRYLTGRAYDPRNPGEGRFISSAEIASLFDPVVANGAFSEDQDSDNDGLPDLIEFAIGTNPVDFDTDGDGLPDGFEILVAGTDPLDAYTVLGVSDAMRNYDGDAMAITSPEFEKTKVAPTPKHVKSLSKFAFVDADGDTDGVQWYVMPTADVPTNIVYTDDREGYIVKVGDVAYVTTVKPAVVTNAATVRLSADLSPDRTWKAGVFTNASDGVVNLIRLMPTRLVAGTTLAEVPDTTSTTNFGYVYFATAVKDSMTAWPYGRASVSTSTVGIANPTAYIGFGMLVPGRYQDAPAGHPLAALPEVDDSIAYIHHLVYQEFGFDPRTAWNPNTPLGARWGKTATVNENGETTTEAKDNNIAGDFHYAGISTRTRAYTLYDEFLTLSFFLNGGAAMDVAPSKANPWYRIWSRYTTNGRGPGEAALAKETENYKGREAINGSPDENGADTDADGVPDGWELYVMSGPKRYDKDTKKYYFRFPGPYADGYLSAFGPFEPYAKNASYTDNDATSGYDTAGGDNDGLTEYQEFAGTDTTLYYADYSTTVTRPDEHKGWLNKFFPSDPWNADTDGDGVKDNDERGTFQYGTPADNGALVTIPGGGLNPLSVDTDFDGLPDGWERQFKGSTIYAGDDPTYAKDADGNDVVGNPLEGLVDGMDGTVPDAFTATHGPGATANSTQTLTLTRVDGSKMFGKVNRDYDHDGLENWQEYMAGTMRCWRYDDPLTPWDFIPGDAHLSPPFGSFSPEYEDINRMYAVYAADEKPIIDTSAPDGGYGEYWYRLLVDKTSPIYNPRLISGLATGAQYFSPLTNGWDLAYVDETAGGAWYYFKDRVGDTGLDVLWIKTVQDRTNKKVGNGGPTKPNKYISCSPIDADSDHDGMDDYYELFHGMNPLLGESGVPLSGDVPCDIVYDAWRDNSGATFLAWGDNANFWTWATANAENYKTGTAPRGTGYDFEYYPWLNGLAAADPDGDDVRNQIEGIMPKLATSTWLHTDPTPLWMTDTTYDRSLTRLYYRMPGRVHDVGTATNKTFTYNGVTYHFIDFCGWAWDDEHKVGTFNSSVQDLWWGLFGANTSNWMFSFEENEGYDSDHDAMGDYDEVEGRLRAASDPQDANSPNRRQAMFFQGPAKPSALQLPLEVEEEFPVSRIGYPDEPTFLMFTVECWVRADSLADATLVERAVYSDESKAGDEEFVRKNFQLGIKGRKWYAKYDSNGTLARSAVEILSNGDADIGVWHHIAATYDGARFILYVDGQEAAVPVESSVQPEYGSSAMILYRGTNKADDFEAGEYRGDIAYSLKTIVVGASLKTVAEGGSYKAFDLNKAMGWDYYNRFFAGYIDEIRVWDGARKADDIRADYYAKKRYTRETAIENRLAFYKGFEAYGNRYRKDADGDDVSVVPELVYHFSFDSVPGGADESVVAKVPHGFDYYQPAALGNPERGAAVLSRPLDWNASWWAKIVANYGSVYSSDQWVQWVPNTVAHLPRFDGTTLDSFFWSENSSGDARGSYYFARTAEPASRWVQLTYNKWLTREGYYVTSGMRHHLIGDWHGFSDDDGSTNANRAADSVYNQFLFTGRHALQDGMDLLPLGGAYAKSCASMWDAQGASTAWEISGGDANFNDLPDIWEQFAVANYSPETEPLTWTTIVYWKSDVMSSAPGVRMTAGEAYKRDLAHGRVVATNDDGDLDVVERRDLAQTADEDASRTPDWWDDMYNVYGEGGTADTDNDGLNNYVEYLVSEVFPFGMLLNPRMPKTDTKTLDYFRKFGKLYIGEMFTDHDQMEDWWERGLGSKTVDVNVWDAQRDGDEDGWSNFAENRYNNWCQSTLAKLISHAVGDATVLDMPKPTIKLTARYNGSRDLSKGSVGAEGGGAAASAMPTLHVLTYTDPAMMKVDAEFIMQPGTVVSREFFMGSWENRVVRGTLDPGYIAYGDVDILFAQLPQDNMYSWTDANNVQHVSRPYSEFKEALSKDPNIIQNVVDFAWDHLVPATAYGATAEKAVTVTSSGEIAIYGERVGKIDMQTGDFEFDMAALSKLSFDGFFEGSVANKWGLKEAVYKLVYTAKVPDTELYKVTASLAHPAKGFIKGGVNSIMAYWDVGNDGAYTPGTDPFGVVRDVDIGWRERNVEIELSETSAITPRIKLWEGDAGGESSGGSSGGGSAAGSEAASDRIARFGLSQPTNATTATLPTSQDVRVRVLCVSVDDLDAADIINEDRIILDRTFSRDVRDYIHEGDFLGDGSFDIDWATFEDDIVGLRPYFSNFEITNVAYAVVIGEGNASRIWSSNGKEVFAHPVLITRRYEVTHTAPTAVGVNGDSVCRVAQPTFRWRIDGEDPWASAYGTTYTAFRIKVKDLAGNEVYDSGYQRMPAADSTGVYNWTAPLYVNCPSPSGNHLVFKNLENYTWQVFTYNAKFKTDEVGSTARTFRMNVTDLDLSSFGLDVKVCYDGPAQNRSNRIHVQAFESPDFTGYPVAEAVVTNVAIGALAASNGVPTRLIGLRAGTYFLRAYIDTDYDWALDDWESWGYLCERDTAAVTGTKSVFDPVSVTVGPEVKGEASRTIHIEDRDTDGDCFPDVWEAEQNGNAFDSEKVKPVTGDAELIAVNPTLTSKLLDKDYIDQDAKAQLLQMLGRTYGGKYGVSLLSGLSVSSMKMSASGAVSVPATVVEDTVAIKSLAVDRDKGEIVLGVAAETDAESIDPAVAALYSIERGASVTVKVYRTETLAAEWQQVAETTLTITSEGTEVRAPLPDGIDTKSGFFKVEIEQ